MSGSTEDFLKIIDSLRLLTTRAKQATSPSRTYDPSLPPNSNPNILFWCSGVYLKCVLSGEVYSDGVRPSEWDSVTIGVGVDPHTNTTTLGLPRLCWTDEHNSPVVNPLLYTETNGQAVTAKILSSIPALVRQATNLAEHVNRRSQRQPISCGEILTTTSIHMNHVVKMERLSSSHANQKDDEPNSTIEPEDEPPASPPLPSALSPAGISPTSDVPSLGIGNIDDWSCTDYGATEPSTGTEQLPVTPPKRSSPPAAAPLTKTSSPDRLWSDMDSPLCLRGKSVAPDSLPVPSCSTALSIESPNPFRVSPSPTDLIGKLKLEAKPSQPPRQATRPNLVRTGERRCDRCKHRNQEECVTLPKASNSGYLVTCSTCKRRKMPCTYTVDTAVSFEEILEQEKEKRNVSKTVVGKGKKRRQRETGNNSSVEDFTEELDAVTVRDSAHETEP